VKCWRDIRIPSAGVAGLAWRREVLTLAYAANVTGAWLEGMLAVGGFGLRRRGVMT
jgi:hypothetical protein